MGSSLSPPRPRTWSACGIWRRRVPDRRPRVSPAPSSGSAHTRAHCRRSVVTRMMLKKNSPIPGFFSSLLEQDTAVAEVERRPLQPDLRAGDAVSYRQPDRAPWLAPSLVGGRRRRSQPGDLAGVDACRRPRARGDGQHPRVTSRGQRRQREDEDERERPRALVGQEALGAEEVAGTEQAGGDVVERALDLDVPEVVFLGEPVEDEERGCPTRSSACACRRCRRPAVRRG